MLNVEVLDAEHEAVTVTFDVMIPLALLLRVQFSPAGWVWIVTEYDDPLAYGEAKVWLSFAVKLSVSFLLSCTTSVPLRPVALTLIV
jgi:hypothetical protein